MAKIKISKISIGKDRIHQDLGDVDSLVESIRINGLLNPITVKQYRDDDTYHLLSGFRRIKACKKLGWKTIEANILNYSPFFSLTKSDPFENPCQVCDYPITEVHHIRPRQFGGTDDEENLIHLCPTHHAVFDFLTKMHSLDDNPQQKQRRFSKESRSTWKLLEMNVKIRIYDPNAVVYFDEYIKPKLPTFLLPTDAEFFRAYELVEKDLKKQGSDTNDISENVLYDLVINKIKKSRKKTFDES